MKRRSFLAMLGLGPAVAVAASTDSSDLGSKLPIEFRDGQVLLDAIRVEVKAELDKDHQRRQRLLADILHLQKRRAI